MTKAVKENLDSRIEELSERLAYEQSAATKAKNATMCLRWITGAERAAAAGDLQKLYDISQEITDKTGIPIGIFSLAVDRFYWSQWDHQPVNPSWLSTTEIRREVLKWLERNGLTEMFTAAEELQRRRVQ